MKIARTIVSFLLTAAILLSLFGSARSFWSGVGSHWAAIFALGFIAYLLLEFNELKLRQNGFGEFEVDTQSWWTRPVSWAAAAGYVFCLIASR